MNRQGYTGTFTMYGGEISQNTAYSSSLDNGNGGGVYIETLGYSYSGTFIMYDGEISRNKAFNAGGVGVAGTFTMSGGKISQNTAGRYGGGVAADGTFAMSGGEILENAAKGFGDGVAVAGVSRTSGVVTRNGSFTMSGNARVNTDNPVGLIFAVGSDGTGVGTYLTIGGDFTGGDPVAKIDLLSWTDGSLSVPPAYDWPGKEVLYLDTASYPSGSLSALRNRFVLGNFVYTNTTFLDPPIPTPITGYVISASGRLQSGNN